MHRLFFLRHGLESPDTLDMRVGVGQRHLSQLGLQEQLGSGITAAFIRNQLGTPRIDRLNAVELSYKCRFVTTCQIIRTHTVNDLILATARRLYPGDQPFSITTKRVATS
jgi:hypothetical protein